ncbi:7443_t:CDS:2 [Acaulospora colombiana]|uniref:7443_t:CDS:1 n=1 Tax=Acaulospora colombiana TaxID=27376 RepID=A0ACA9NM03_9GLOM|nr:7443_t:CDS:2 [Acaulospora colombiana]
MLTHGSVVDPPTQAPSGETPAQPPASNSRFGRLSSIKIPSFSTPPKTTPLKVEKANVGGINRSTYRVNGGKHDGWWAKTDGHNKIGQNEVDAVKHFDKSALTGKDASGRTWIVQKDKGVALERLPQFQKIINGQGTANEKMAAVDKLLPQKMNQLDKMVTGINKQGWIHWDIQPGNVRWDPRTGKPTAIDWGLAQKYRESEKWYKGGKVADWVRNRKDNEWPKEPYDKGRWRANIHVAVNRSQAPKTGC